MRLTVVPFSSRGRAVHRPCRSLHTRPSVYIHSLHTLGKEWRESPVSGTNPDHPGSLCLWGQAYLVVTDTHGHVTQLFSCKAPATDERAGQRHVDDLDKVVELHARRWRAQNYPQGAPHAATGSAPLVERPARPVAPEARRSRGSGAHDQKTDHGRAVRYRGLSHVTRHISRSDFSPIILSTHAC